MSHLAVIKTVLLVILIFSFVVWGAVTGGFASEAKAGEESQSAWALSQKYAPDWWKRFNRWFIPIWVITFVVSLILSRLSGDNT